MKQTHPQPFPKSDPRRIVLAQKPFLTHVGHMQAAFLKCVLQGASQGSIKCSGCAGLMDRHSAKSLPCR